MIALAGACQHAEAPRPAVLADPGGPGATALACEPLPAGDGVLHARVTRPATAALDWLPPVGTDAEHALQCRVDGAVDLDGDGIVDCWRFVRGDPAALWVWPRCAGKPISLQVGRWVASPVAIPDELASYSLGIARVLAGPDHAGCARATPACPPAPAVATWFAEASRVDTGPWHTYTPRWEPGVVPAPPELSAVVRDGAPAEAHDEDLDVPPGVPLGRVVVIDPDGHPRVEDGAGAFVPIMDCDDWTVWSSPWFTAVVDHASQRWSWVLERGDNGATIEVACADGLVFVPGTLGIDARVLTVVNPVASAFGTIGYDGEWWPEVRDHYLRTYPVRSTAQLRAQVRPTPPAGECDVTGPLLDTTPDGPCTLHGRDDVDGDGVADCWTMRHEGNREAGTLAWAIAVAPGCGESGMERAADVAHVVSVIDGPTELGEHGLRWLADRLAGAANVTCWPAAPGCPAPDAAAARWLVRSYFADPPPPDWRAGDPQLPPRTLTLVANPMAVNGKRSIVLVRADAPALGRDELARRTTCGDLDVWTAPFGGAVVDRRSHRSAWLYVVNEGNFNEWPDPITRAWCDGDRIAFGGARGSVVRADPRTGALVYH